MRRLVLSKRFKPNGMARHVWREMMVNKVEDMVVGPDGSDMVVHFHLEDPFREDAESLSYQIEDGGGFVDGGFVDGFESIEEVLITEFGTRAELEVQ